MSLWQNAYETYENHAHLVGVIKENQQPLTPVGHIVQKAQIEITIRADGSLISVFSVPSDNSKTIIPATEASSSRTSSPCAHPLSDQMQYLADMGEKKKKDKDSPHELYLKALTDWAESKYSHPKVKAILSYIKSGTILDDVKREIPNCEKIEGTELSKCMVRWSVVGTQSEKSACWEDRSLFSAFESYQKSLKGDSHKGLCMVSGENDTIIESHPKGIVSSSYGAKLLSANDSSGFTYRGRFTDSVQALTVGYTASQKMHNAIQWVAANQGKIFGGRTFVCWNPKGKDVLSPYNDPWGDSPDEPIQPSDYKKNLHEAMAGYKNSLPAEEDVIIASFDAATTGRLSVTYYNELKASDYYDRIETWYSSCCIENKQSGVQSPTLIRIINAAYGTERNGKLEVDDRVLKEQFGRLYHCIVDSAPIPSDMVRALMIHASEPTKYNPKFKNHDTVLFSACAVIRKYLNDRAHEEEWSMVLDTNNTNRSYLFGRLLAVMEYAERSAYEKGENRETNAIRLQTSYCNRPLATAKIIENSLNPYFQKLSPGLRFYCKNMIEEIYIKFNVEDLPRMNLPLDETYLLGYYLQRNALYQKKDKAEKSDITENTEENE